MENSVEGMTEKRKKRKSEVRKELCSNEEKQKGRRITRGEERSSARTKKSKRDEE